MSNIGKMISDLDLKSKGRIWLIPGLLCGLFSSGIFASALLAWFYPLFLWKTTVSTKKNNVLNYVLIGLVIWITANFKFFGMIEGEDLLFHALLFLTSPLFYLPPFIIAGILYRKLSNKILRILLLPALWTIADWLTSTIGFGAFASIANSQINFTTFMQLTSLTGFYGLIFFMVTVSTFIVEVWNNGFHIKGNKQMKHALVFIVCFVASVFLYGTFRLSTNSTAGDTTRVASIQNFYSAKDFVGHDKLIQKFSDENFETMLSGMSKDVELAKNGNAKVALWQEVCFPVRENNLQKLISHASELAKKYDIALIVPIDTIMNDGSVLNQLALINKDGNLESMYKKVNLVPFVETSTYEKGSDDISCMKVDDVNISSCICFDALDPILINSSIDKSTDILLVPAWEWEIISNYAGPSSIFRSVENGISYVRNTSNGVTFCVDQFGRPLTWHKTNNSNEEVVFSDVPDSNVFTVYKYVGNWLIYVCCAYVLFVLGYVVVSGFKRKHH